MKTDEFRNSKITFDTCGERSPHFFEQTVEVVLVRDPDDRPDLAGGQGGRAEELLGLLDAEPGDVLVDRAAEVFFKAAAQMVLAVGADLSVVPEQLVELLKKTPSE